MTHIKLHKIPYCIAFALTTVPKDELGLFEVKGLYHSGQPEFYQRLEHISSVYLNNSVITSQIHSFLLLIHTDDTADLYINDIPIVMKIRTKKKINKNDYVKEGDIADIDSLSFQNIDIGLDDNIVFCFKVGWRSGVYFNFQPKDQKINITKMNF